MLDYTDWNYTDWKIILSTDHCKISDLGPLWSEIPCHERRIPYVM